VAEVAQQAALARRAALEQRGLELVSLQLEVGAAEISALAENFHADGVRTRANPYVVRPAWTPITTSL
jgi:hypothetical protein